MKFLRFISDIIYNLISGFKEVEDDMIVINEDNFDDEMEPCDPPEIEIEYDESEEVSSDEKEENYVGKEYKGIDVSSWQDKINWRDVKNSGVEFAILRITEKNGVDTQFKRNSERCDVRRIPWGVYKFSYALNVEDAKREATDVITALQGKKPQYPVFLDLEWSEQKKLGKAAVEKIALAFLNEIEKAGYRVGIYCNVDWYNNVLTDKLKQYDLWLASYPANDNGTVQERLRPPVGVAWQYSSAGKVPGINGKVDMDIFYKNYKDDNSSTNKPKKEEATPKPSTPTKTGVTAQDVIAVMRSWLGLSRSAQTHRVIIDTYNSYKPLARGYAVSYYDDYCDTTVSAVFIKLGAVDLIGGTECGVENHVKIFQAKGIWQEDGSVTPQPGWIIVYDWQGTDVKTNNGYSDHIGFVESVSNGKITTIEGNTSGGIVGRNTIPVGYKYIRGFAIPKYAEVGNIPSEDSDDVASTPGVLSKTRKFVGKANKATSVREWAGIKYDTITSYPSLGKGDLVDVCDEEDGWYYVRIADKFYGFVDKKYIDKV